MTNFKLLCPPKYCFDLNGLVAVGLCVKFLVLTDEEGGILAEQR